MPQPSGCNVGRELLDPVTRTRRTQVVEQPRPRCLASSGDDPLHLRAQIRSRIFEPGHNLLLSHRRVLEHVQQDRAQLRDDWYNPHRVSLVPRSLGTAHRQAPALPVHIRPAKQSDL
ncbi:MAG: hypothetical protein R3B58_11325 [Phycisphaerales bacterium]